MSKGIFIAATGTDVGKTYVSALIVKQLRISGLSAGYYKPALSGAEFDGESLTPGDCRYVAAKAGLAVRPQDLTSYMYKMAASPHLAARMEQRPVEADVILADFAKFAEKHDYITVEGCGGIVCPFRLEADKTLMQTDIIKLMKLDVLIVAPAGLGAINSAVATVHYAESQGIAVKGIILNRYDETELIHRDNRRSIERLTQRPVVACIASQESGFIMDTAALCALYKEV